MASYDFKDQHNESGFGGFKDYVLYDQFFETLDSLQKNSSEKNLKYFGFLATISSHSPWPREKGNHELPYCNPEKIEDDYANTLFHVDSYLRVFINELNKRKYLNNSIIIITGDHGQPVNEHGNISRAVGAYEENFRTPLLMLWKDSLKPARINNQVFSQIDIAPTLLDLLKIKMTNHFLGNSFFDKNQGKNNVIFLVQPVDGVYLCVIKFPFKYILHVSNKKEYLYNLVKDPCEKNNLINNAGMSVYLNYFRKELSFWRLNEYLLENNKIWFEKAKMKSSYKIEAKKSLLTK